MFKSWSTVIAYLLLTFTGTTSARADKSHWSQPTVSIQLGSLAGTAQLEGDKAIAIGAQLAVLIKFGRLGVGAEYDYLKLGDYPRRGQLGRYALIARAEIARINRGFGGENATLVLWIDGGVGRQTGTWHDGRPVQRNDISMGGGFSFEHRVELSTRPRVLETVAWRLGWHVTAAERFPEGPQAIASCRRKADGCPTMDTTIPYDVGFTLVSSLVFNW